MRMMCRINPAHKKLQNRLDAMRKYVYMPSNVDVYKNYVAKTLQKFYFKVCFKTVHE